MKPNAKNPKATNPNINLYCSNTVKIAAPLSPKTTNNSDPIQHKEAIKPAIIEPMVVNNVIFSVLLTITIINLINSST